MKREFKLQYDWWEAVLSVEEEKAAEDIKESVEFWYQWEHHLASCKGDYTLAFVKNVAPILLEASMENGVAWLREEFFNNREGYCFPFDGSKGVYLELCDEWNFDSELMDISEINPAKKEVNREA